MVRPVIILFRIFCLPNWCPKI